MAEMNLPDEQGQAAESSAPAALVVATVSEDAITARCAQRLIGRILRMSGREMPVEEDGWSFHLMDQPDGMAAAGRRAGAADVVVIAAWRNSVALARVIEWLQHWLAPRRGMDGALVFISVEREETGPAVDPMEERLTHVARQIGMDFFATHIAPAAEFLRGNDATSSPHESHHPRLERFPTGHDQARAHRR
jgi:hypothetical protein